MFTTSFINSLQTSGTEETSCWAPQFLCILCRWIVFISIKQSLFLTYYRYPSWFLWAVNINNIIKYKIHEIIHNIYLDFRIQFLALVLKMSPVPIRKKKISDPNLAVIKLWITNALLLSISKFNCLYKMMVHLNLLVTNQRVWRQREPCRKDSDNLFKLLWANNCLTASLNWNFIQLL